MTLTIGLLYTNIRAMNTPIRAGIKKAPLLTAAFFLAISVLTFFESLAIQKQLSLADRLTPLSPDTYLKILAALIALVTFLYLGKELLFPRRSANAPSHANLADLIAGTAIFIGYIAAASWLGYLLSTFLFYFFFLRFVGRYSYLKTSLISVPIALSFELVFEAGLQIQLPPGFWNF